MKENIRKKGFLNRLLASLTAISIILMGLPGMTAMADESQWELVMAKNDGSHKLSLYAAGASSLSNFSDHNSTCGVYKAATYANLGENTWSIGNDRQYYYTTHESVEIICNCGKGTKVKAFVCNLGSTAREDHGSGNEGLDSCKYCNMPFTASCVCSSLLFHDGQAPTCTAAGWKPYFKCVNEDCGKIYATENNRGTSYANLNAWKASDVGKIDAPGHEWRYNASGATLTATCNRDASHTAALTLSATQQNYSGNSAIITVGTDDEVTAWEGANLTVPTEISYETSTGTDLGTTAPTTAGSYVAKVSPVGETASNDNTAKVSFTISDSNPTTPITINGADYLYDANLISVGSGRIFCSICNVSIAMDVLMEDGNWNWIESPGDFDACLSAGHIKEKPAHEHSFTYTLATTTTTNDTIKATCSNSDGNCGLTGDKSVTLTLSASSANYSGGAYTGASLGTTTSWTTAGLSEPEIKYVGRGGTTYSESTTAPTAVGTYTAKITAGGETATKDFEITKIDISSVTFTEPTAPAYGGTPASSVAGTGANYSGAISWSPAATTFGYSTAYTATITLAAADNYKFKSDVTIPANWTKSDTSTDTSLVLTRTYTATEAAPHTCGSGVKQDGQAATCTADGFKDYYKCGGCDKLYKEAACTNEITDLTTWKTTDGQGKIAALGHAWGYNASGATLTATCTRDSAHTAALTLTASSVNYSGSAAYDGATLDAWDTFKLTTGLTADPTYTYYKVETSGATAGGTATSAENVRKSAGNYYANVTISGTGTGLPANIVAPFVVNKADPVVGDFTYNAPASLGYDGNAKTATVVANAGKTSGTVTIKYYNSADAEVASPTAPGTYKVKITVAGDDNYNAVTTPLQVGTFEITKATIPDGKKPTAGKKVYVSSGKATAQTGTVTLDTLSISTSTIPGATITSVTEKTDTNNIISSISGATYTTGTNLTAGHTATLTVTIGSTNYSDFTYDLMVEVKAKTALTISGLSAPGTNPTYSGNPVAKTIFGTPTVSGTTAEGGTFSAADLIYTYEGREGTTYTASTTAPTNVGKYTVTVAVPDANENYSGSVSYNFEILKATPAAPNATAVAPTSSSATDGKITGVNDTMEYKLDTGSGYPDGYTSVTESATAITGLAAGTKVKVRVKAAEPNSNAGIDKELTVPAYSAPSGSGGGYTPTPTTPSETIKIPVDDGNTTVYVDATVKDGNAEVKEISTSDINKIVDNSTPGNETNTITIDVSAAKQDVGSVTLTKTTVDTLAKTTADNTNKIETVEVKLSKATVELDAKALGAINDQANGNNVKIVVEDTKSSDLNTSQQTALKNMEVVTSFEATVESNGVKIHDFKGGQVNVTIAFVVPTGKSANHYFVYYVADNGTMEKFSTNVSNGKLTFTTTHFSDYVIVYDETEENDNNKPAEEPQVTAPTKAQIAKNTITLNSGLKVSQTGKTLNVSWGKVADANGYIVYAAYCGNTIKKVKTITDTDTTSHKISKLDGKALSLTKNCKVIVKAYQVIDGKKVEIGRTITAHVVGSKNTKYTNAKSIKITSASKVTLNVGKTSKIKAETVLVSAKKKQLSDGHAKEFRFISSNTAVATVDANGKITAKKAGKCTIYVYARNGYAKKVTVTVK